MASRCAGVPPVVARRLRVHLLDVVRDDGRDDAALRSPRPSPVRTGRATGHGAAWIAAIAIVVLLEKVVAKGPWLSRVAGLAAIAAGLALIIRA